MEPELVTIDINIFISLLGGNTVNVNICYQDYPASITVTSTGPAAEKRSNQMGLYVLEENKTAQLRPVYKKTDRDYYIYYDGKLYFILVISVSQLC